MQINQLALKGIAVTERDRCFTKVASPVYGENFALSSTIFAHRRKSRHFNDENLTPLT